MKIPKQKTPVNVLVAGATLLAFVVFTTTLIHAAVYDPTDSGIGVPQPAQAVSRSPAPASYPKVSSGYSGEPASIAIPAISVDANVQHVGVAADGHMAVPDNFTDVAWYRDGPAPGDNGTAVIDGHVDNGLGLAGVFKHLSDIKVGDEVDVTTEGGQTVKFKVISIDKYPYENVPASAIFGSVGSPALRLITCTGGWVQSGRTYDHRLVVTAVEES